MARKDHQAIRATAPAVQQYTGEVACTALSRSRCARGALASHERPKGSGKWRHQLVTGRFPAGSSKSDAAYILFTGYPAYVTAYSPSKKCRIFCDNKEPVPKRPKHTFRDWLKEHNKPLPWINGNKLFDLEDFDPVRYTPEESKAQYRKWLADPDRDLHPNAYHNPNICPECFASLEVCTCKKKPGLALALGSYRLIELI